MWDQGVLLLLETKSIGVSNPGPVESGVSEGRVARGTSGAELKLTTSWCGPSLRQTTFISASVWQAERHCGKQFCAPKQQLASRR